MRLVVDANVAIKWFVRENLHAEARHLLVRDEALFAPDFLAIELANIAWKKARIGDIGEAQAFDIAAFPRAGAAQLVASEILLERAINIALALGHPVYDCRYLACAEYVDGVLVTADARLSRAVENSSYDPLVQSLDAWALDA